MREANVVASWRSVVASVVAQRERSNATTDTMPERSVVAQSPAAHDRRGLVWRIEINRRSKADGGYSYHWLYRFGSGKDRRAVYGGTIDQLIALNPARWAAYQENSGDE